LPPVSCKVPSDIILEQNQKWLVDSKIKNKSEIRKSEEETKETGVE
jgi:hypothetical protein